jgi:hypothetical protein
MNNSEINFQVGIRGTDYQLGRRDTNCNKELKPVIPFSGDDFLEIRIKPAI